MRIDGYRKSLLILVIGAAAGFVAGRWGDPPRVTAAAEPANVNWAQVLQVNHGDEFEILWRPPMPLRFAVRLKQADTPYKDQEHGEEAAEALADLVYGNKVRIEFENPDDPLQDRSERLLAYAFLPDGRMVNVEMVRRGWAEHFTRFGTGRYEERFAAAEQAAKEAGRGRWAGRDDAPRQ